MPICRTVQEGKKRAARGNQRRIDSGAASCTEERQVDVLVAAHLVAARRKPSGSSKSVPGRNNPKAKPRTRRMKPEPTIAAANVNRRTGRLAPCRDTRNTPHLSRAGLIAIRELFVVFAAVAGVSCGAAYLPEIFTNPTELKSCSDRSVYRISLDRTGERLWVYRPGEDVAQLNLKSGQREASLPIGGMEVSALAHSREGATTLVCGTDDVATLIRDGQDVAQIQANSHILKAAVSSNGFTSAFLTKGGRVLGWIARGQRLREFSYDLKPEPAIIQIAFNNTGNRLYVARCDGTIARHNADTGTLQGLAWRSGSTVVSFAMTEDGQRLGVATDDGRLLVYDTRSKRLLCKGRLEPRFQSCHAVSLQFSSDGKHIAAATRFSTAIQIWDVEAGTLGGRLSGHDGPVSSMQFSEDSDQLYSASYDGSVREWSLKSYSQTRVIDQ
jgi:WD40 repeat protein